MAINTLDQKFLHDVGDIYDAEHRFLEGQQLMLKSATDPKLQMMLETHIRETKMQIENLEQVYSLLGESPKRITCDAAKGLVSEAEKGLTEAKSNPAVLDCCIASAAAKVEHYEIASYRGLITAAQLNGQNEVMALLAQNLQQEEQTAQKIEQSTPTLLQQAMTSRTVGQ